MIVDRGRTDVPLKENITRPQFVGRRVFLDERLIARHGGAPRHGGSTRDGHAIIGIAVH